jgi:hypothetical protein
VGDDELHLASAQPEIDRAGREVAGELADRGRQHVEHHELRRGIRQEALHSAASSTDAAQVVMSPVSGATPREW